MIRWSDGYTVNRLELHVKYLHADTLHMVGTVAIGIWQKRLQQWQKRLTGIPSRLLPLELHRTNPSHPASAAAADIYTHVCTDIYRYTHYLHVD